MAKRKVDPELNKQVLECINNEINRIADRKATTNKILKINYSIRTDEPVDKYEQEKTQEGMFVEFLESLVKSKVLKCNTKIDSEGFMSIDFEITAYKLE